MGWESTGNLVGFSANIKLGTALSACLALLNTWVSCRQNSVRAAAPYRSCPARAIIDEPHRCTWTEATHLMRPCRRVADCNDSGGALVDRALQLLLQRGYCKTRLEITDVHAWDAEGSGVSRVFIK